VDRCAANTDDDEDSTHPKDLTLYERLSTTKLLNANRLRIKDNSARCILDGRQEQGM